MSNFNDDFTIISATINVTNDCNLACSYCFEKDKEKKNMSIEDGIEIFKNLYTNFLLHNDDHKKLEINFFGGEPFLNFDVIKAIILYASENKCRVQYGITTNLTILSDEMIYFIDLYNINLLVSLDGLPEVHNKNRCNSYEVVKNNLFKLYNYGLSPLIQVRMTVTPDQIYFLLDSVKHLFYDLKVDNIIPVIVSDQEWNEQQKEELKKHLKNLFEFFYEHTEKGDLNRNLFLKPVEDSIYRCYMFFDEFNTPCGYGNNSWVSVGVNGELFPCHQRHTIKEYQEELYLGNILTGESLGSKLKGNIKNWKATSRDCSSCKAYNICSGWCPSESLTAFGNANTTPEIVCIYYNILFELVDEFMIKIIDLENLRSPLLNTLKINYSLLKEFETLKKLNVLDEEFPVKLASFYDKLMNKLEFILPSFLNYYKKEINNLFNMLDFLQKGVTLVYGKQSRFKSKRVGRNILKNGRK